MEKPFRHPFEELRLINSIPLAEVLVLGQDAALRGFAERCKAADAVAKVKVGGGWNEQTRLIVVGDEAAALATRLGADPPARTCVVADTTGDFPAAALPVPGMCLRMDLALGEGGELVASLAPESTTIGEALELLAELLASLDIETTQAPRDRAPTDRI